MFSIITFGISNKSYSLDREMIYVIQIIFENEIISKYCEIDKEKIITTLMRNFESSNIVSTYLNTLIVKAIINDSRIELSNQIKLNLVLYFMENDCSNSEKYPENKGDIFEEYLIEILKSIDSFTFDDSEKLLKLIDKCINRYSKLVNYIKSIFNTS